MKGISKVALVLSVAMLALAGLANADTSGKHPACLHALSDLRPARAYLKVMTSSDRLDEAEANAIREINAATGEINQTSIDDGKDLDDQPSIDTHLDQGNRFRKALELLNKS